MLLAVLLWCQQLSPASSLSLTPMTRPIRQSVQGMHAVGCRVVCCSPSLTCQARGGLGVLLMGEGGRAE